jgi:hypothetical protein
MTVENTRNWLTGAFVKPDDIMVNVAERSEGAYLGSYRTTCKEWKER